MVGVFAHEEELKRDTRRMQQLQPIKIVLLPSSKTP